MSDKSARSIGSATISFGLVSAACKIYSAVREGGENPISFNLLHRSCGSRLKQQYICINENVVVERDQMDKGFEYSKDTYVKFSADELKSLEEKSTYTIDIESFVPLHKIDPVYFDKPYFLGPDKGAAKAYSLLAEAMKRTERAGIAHYSARGKAYIVCLRAVGNGIVMNYLRYADEVKSMKDIPLDPVEPKEAEVALALQLVATLATPDFDPSKYRDDVKDRIAKAIQEKIDGKEITIQASPVAPQIVDIMEALRASLGLAQKQM